MTHPIIQDELGLAEAVAAGELSLEDAEARLAAADSRSRDAKARELHRTVDAIEAVRAHARATVAASVTHHAVGGPGPSILPGSQVGGAIHEPRGTERPGVVIPVRRGPVRPRSTRVQDGRALAVAASLVLVAGALGFAFAGSRAISPSPRPSSNGLATFATSGPSVAPAAAAFPAADRPEVFETATQFALTSATVGWLRTYDPTSRTGNLYRTADAGRTWTELAAPMGLTRFVDDTTAFIAADDSRIVVTHDGGATWQAAPIAAPPGAVGPWFLTAASPNLAFATYAASDSIAELLVYSTTDGGATWSGPTRSTTAILDASFNKPQGGDDGLLWMTLGKADNKPFDNRVAISTDGGATWSIQPLPADSTFPASSLKGPSAIREDAAGHEVLAISDGDVTGVYATTDAGATWARVRLLSDGGSLDLRTDAFWVATTPTAFWSTTDAGLTWRQTPRESEPPVVGVTFATPDVGWAEVICGHHSWQTQVTPDPTCQGRTTGVVFMATADGGATWEPMGR